MSRISKIFYFSSNEEKDLIDTLSSDYASVYGKTVSSVISDAILSSLLPNSQEGRIWIEEMYYRHTSVGRVISEMCLFIAKNAEDERYNQRLWDILKYCILFNLGYGDKSPDQIDFEVFCTLADSIADKSLAIYHRDLENIDASPCHIIPGEVNWLKSKSKIIRNDSYLPVYLDYFDTLNAFHETINTFPETYQLLSWIARNSSWASTDKARVSAIQLVKLIFE